jgi:hypothetical protein
MPSRFGFKKWGWYIATGREGHRPQNAQQGFTISSTSPMVISNLVKCVSSTKGYLDLFFAIPAAEHTSLPISAWYQVIFGGICAVQAICGTARST